MKAFTPGNSRGVEILSFRHVAGSSVDLGGRVPLQHLGKPKPGHRKRLISKVTQPVRTEINSEFRISKQRFPVSSLQPYIMSYRTLNLSCSSIYTCTEGHCYGFSFHAECLRNTISKQSVWEAQLLALF